MRHLVLALALFGLCAMPQPARACQEWAPPTDDQISKLTSSDYWGWVINCRTAAPGDEGRKVLEDLTKRFAKDKYHEQVWTAIWTQMSEAEERMQREPDDPEPKKKVESSMADLQFLAEAIEKALGDKSYLDRLAEQRSLDPEARKKKAWAIERYNSAKHALEAEKDYNSALQRVEAGWAEMEKVRDKHWMHLFLSLKAECCIGLKKNPDAAGHWRQALALAKEANEAEYVAEYEAKLKEMEASGVAMKRSALDGEDSWDTKTDDKGWTTVAMAPGGGKGQKLPFRFPNRYARENTFFWKRIYLKDDQKGTGGVNGAEKMGLPGSAWLVKEPGKQECKISEDPSKGGEKFKVGLGPETERFRCTYPNVKAGGKPMVLDYWYEVCAPTLVQIWKQKTTVANPPDILDLKVRGATWRTGRGPEGPFTIIDGNFNGQFGCVWEAAMEEHKDVGNDGLLVGGGRKGLPFSPLVKMGKSWYLIDPVKNSLQCRFKKFTGATAKTAPVTLRLDGIKAKPYWVIISMPFTFKDGTREVSTVAHIDISEAIGKPMEIPTGSWSLTYALLADGDDEERATRVEVMPNIYPAVDVDEGKTAEFVLGGTLVPVIEAAYAEGANEVQVKVDTFKVYGERGEIYHSFWPDVFEYSYEVCDDRGGLGVKGAARKWSEKEQKPQGWEQRHLEFPKWQADKPNRKPQGNVWVKFSGTDKLLGNLSCQKPPVIPERKAPAAGGEPASDHGAKGDEKKE
jgi:hypothetical protein